MYQVSCTTLVASKNVQILTIPRFDEIRRGSYISRDDSNDEVRFVIRDLEKFLIFDRNYHFAIFQKIRFSRGFTKSQDKNKTKSQHRCNTKEHVDQK